MPADFDRRYDARERALLQFHERQHIVRGDLQVNACAALLRCVFWFNPLVHYAARALRQDQELACDQRVLARHPDARRTYGEALLKAQLASQPMPLGCHWGFGHPLTERIAMLKQPTPSSRRMLAGTACVLVLALSGGYAAWATLPRAPAGTLPADTASVAATAMAAQATRPPTPPQGDAAQLQAPAYPAQALADKIDGTVVLGIDIDAAGKVLAVDVVSSEPAGVFDAASIQAAWGWRLPPLVKDGKPVAGRVEVPVRFEHDRAPGAGAKTPA